MDPKALDRLERFRTEFAQVSGKPFRYFACPILFRDENVPLCRGHIVNVAFRDSSRRWTIQRQDVDNFFGSVFESDFTDLQHNASGVAPKALIDPKLNRSLRPKIMLKGKKVDYFVAEGAVPSTFTHVRFDDGKGQVRLALKMKPSDAATAPAAGWQIGVEKDLSVPAVVSVVKAAHLTLFELFGYGYALSRSGAFVGALLGRFFDENRGKKKHEVLSAAVSHFAPFVAMVRPVANKDSPLVGTIEDGYAQMCWLEGSSPERPWAMIVFVRTAQLLSAALMPMFDDQAGVDRFHRLLERGADRFVTSIARFRGDHWEGTSHRAAVHWPVASFERPAV